MFEVVSLNGNWRRLLENAVLIGRDVQGSFINDLGVFECWKNKNLVKFKIGVTSSIVKIKKTDFYCDPLSARLGMSSFSSLGRRFANSEFLTAFGFLEKPIFFLWLRAVILCN